MTNIFQQQQAELNALLEKCPPDFKFAIVFEGRDTAGKSSTIRELTHYLPDKFYRVNRSTMPSKTIMKHWLPHWGKILNSSKHIILFDRSWYSIALCQPVNHWCTKKQYQNFMRDVLAFERNQSRIVIKFWCSISEAEQKSRIKAREISPLKYWKLSPNDKMALSNYDKMTIKKEAVFCLGSQWHSIDYSNKESGMIVLLRTLNTEIAGLL